MFKRGFGLACALVLTTAGAAQAATVQYDGTRLTVRLEPSGTYAGNQAFVSYSNGATRIRTTQPVTDQTGGAAGCTQVSGDQLACTTGGQPVPLTLIGTPEGDFIGVDAVLRPVRVEGGAGGDVLGGGPLDDTLVGGDGDDQLTGDLGTDVLDGGTGADRITYSGYPTAVTIDVGRGQLPDNDTTASIEGYDGGPGNDRLIGGPGPDRLDGSFGDDQITGAGGADTLLAQLGTDTLRYDERSTGVLVDLQDGVAPDGDFIFGFNHVVGTSGDDVLRGNAANNSFQGLGGNDTIVGRDGDDGLLGGAGTNTLDGGLGNDTAHFGDLDGPITATIGSAALPGIENLVGSRGNDTLVGDGGPNGITGGFGDDAIDGNGGADRLFGSEGNDAVTCWTATEVCNGGRDDDTLRLAQNTMPANLVGELGTDVVRPVGAGGATLVLGSQMQVERLEGTASADKLTGTSGAETIDGLAGDDVVVGAGGADALDGDLGSDTVSYEERSTPVTVDLGTKANPDNDALSGFESATGGGGNDVLRGDGGANALAGLAGDDLLDPGLGSDKLYGGAGTDTVSYAARATGIAALTTNRVTAAGGEVDLLDAPAPGDVETIIGGAGANTLAPSGVVTKLVGGAADDVLAASAARALTLDGGSSGTDRVSYAALPASATTTIRLGGVAGGRDTLLGIDDVTGGPGADRIDGSAGANALDGGGGDDVIDGKGGADRLQGGADRDLLTCTAATAGCAGGGGDDQLTLADGALPGGLDGGDGTDGIVLGGGPATFALTAAMAVEALQGTAAADTLTGTDGAETISGGGGDDTITGGGGTDALRGEAGNDTVKAKDGAVDTIDCGEGEDDALDSDLDDARTACERQPEAPKLPVQEPTGDGGQGATQGSTQTGTTTTTTTTAPPAPAPTTPQAVRPRLQATALTVRAARTGKVSRLALRGLPAGAKVRLTCKGGRAKGCPKARTLAARGTTLALTRYVTARLRAGAVLQVTVTAPGFRARRFTLTGRRTGAPRRVTADLPA